ncbi:hypothetical protein J6590_006322 [Homalodisca vitripennis]|nr:hypothetical protein J6590_006322 [Homalodisca vitripennis]
MYVLLLPDRQVESTPTATATTIVCQINIYRDAIKRASQVAPNKGLTAITIFIARGTASQGPPSSDHLHQTLPCVVHWDLQTLGGTTDNEREWEFCLPEEKCQE